MEQIEKDLLALLEECRDKLSEVDYENAKDLIIHREWGVGLDIICNQLFEYDQKISQEIYNKIEELGKRMEMDEKAWNFFRS